MKTLNAIFSRNTRVSSVQDFEKFAVNENFMINVRGGDGDGTGGIVIMEDEPHKPSNP